MKNIRSFRRLALPFSLAIALLAVSALAVSPRAMADHHDHDDHVEARALLQRGEILPLSRILQIVQQQVPGDVVEVELDNGKHGWEYEVKVLTAAGRVRKVKLNAGNGMVRKIEDD
ncbi:MAG: PepSY domain-containing protein [Rhodanobacter sp.]